MANLNVKIKLMNDTVVEGTLNNGKLFQLQHKNKSQYDAYQKAIKTKPEEQDQFTILRVIYTSILCASIDCEEVLSWEDFLEVAPIHGEDIQAIYDALAPKKNQHLVPHS